MKNKNVIAVKGIPKNWKVKKAYSHISRIIRANFKIQSLDFNKNDPSTKICVLALYPGSNPMNVVQAINKSPFPIQGYIPSSVPNARIPSVPQNNEPKTSTLSKHALKRPVKPARVVIISLWEQLKEILVKYSALFELSRKSDHRILDKISQVFADRFKTLAIEQPDATESCFTLTKQYRLKYPHSGDFGLILKCIQDVDVELSRPLTMIVVNDINIVPKTPHAESIPDNISETTRKFANIMSDQITKHILSLDTEPNSEDSLEVVAQKKIRTELKKVNTYVYKIINQVVANQLVPKKKFDTEISIYGEPTLPKKHVLVELLKNYRILKMTRSDWMHNLLRICIPAHSYSDIVALDGTVIMSCKLIIRPSWIIFAARKLYRIPESITKDLESMCDENNKAEGDDNEDMDMDEANVVDWNMT